MTGTEADGRWIDKRYRVIRRLGQGGMGSVYLVADRRRDDELLALKTVPREDLDGRSLAVLRNEFLSLSTVRHPNVVEVYDFGVDRETSDLFFTFEFIEGCSWLAAANQLDINIAEGLDTFLDVLCQVLRALEFVHSRGMVHADIKPDNILVSGIHQDGTVSTDPPKAKLIDFGLAKQENSQGGEKILGTPYYVAPETILGARADRRTDLYSLGVVLYHLLTGCVPFTGDSNLTILKSHVEKDPVDPRELNPRLPPGLCAIVLRLLRKRPEDRVQSAVVVIDEINRSLGKRFSLETSETLNCYLEAWAGRRTSRTCRRFSWRRLAPTTQCSRRARTCSSTHRVSWPQVGTLTKVVS
jgi:serine/threonine-protein kinase